MASDFQKTRVLVTVMTYPHPSEKYEELVCVAGVTERGEWVRIYPVNYRYQSPEKQFRKYQWIEIALRARGHGNDTRKESREPDLQAIQVTGPLLSPKNNWYARREIIDHLPHHTVKELKALFESERISLGIVRPSRVIDIEIRPTKEQWKPAWETIFNQLRLFESQPKPLRKLPYSFHYVFECADDTKPHKAMIEDWELGVLFLKEAARLGSDEEAAKSVKRKYLKEMCDSTKDTRFFVGTKFPYNTWLVLGVFWPPRQMQTEFLM